jgi:hypothetical protein
MDFSELPKGQTSPKPAQECRNGSPPPVFEVDKTRSYFLVRLRLHPTFVKEAKEPVRLYDPFIVL